MDGHAYDQHRSLFFSRALTRAKSCRMTSTFRDICQSGWIRAPTTARESVAPVRWRVKGNLSYAICHRNTTSQEQFRNQAHHGKQQTYAAVNATPLREVLLDSL